MSIIPQEVPTGAIRYNTDSNKMECFDGIKWWEIAVSSPDLNGGARGLIASGRISSGNPSNVIDYVTISTAGNAIDFGDVTQAAESLFNGECASKVRMIKWGGYPGGHVNTIEYITFSSTGNAVDFGDMTHTVRGGGSLSNATRGVSAGGLNPTHLNNIDYITIASTGNSVDFGDLTEVKDNCTGMASPTIGLFMMGSPDPSTQINRITIATTGNAVYFGDSFTRGWGGGSCSSGTRAVYAGGHQGASPYPTTVAMYEYSFTSRGWQGNWGDLTTSSRSVGNCSSSTRAVWPMGTDEESPNAINNIDYTSMQTRGLAVEFGDISVARYDSQTGSNAHGGL
jgi:hypothetical protein